MPIITFMIGNGFDKQLGLETGYDQFLKWYIDQPSENENIRTYKKELDRDRSSPWWSDAEIAMGKHISAFDFNTLNAYYERVRDFKIKLAEYLLQQQEQCNYSDSKTIGGAFSKFLLNFQNDILLQMKVGNLFSKRQNAEYNFINFNYTNTVDKLVSLSKSLLENGKLYSTKLSQTNYAQGSFGSITAIHGSLDSRIIMGVNDDSQLEIASDKITPKLRRTLVKPETNSALGRIEDRDAEQLINRSDIIAIYGLKLGETDKKWRDLLSDWLKVGYHKVVLFGHMGIENVSPVIPEDILDYVDEKQTAFLKKLYPDITQEELEAMRDRVLVIDKTRYLSFSLVSPKELATVS